MNAFADLYDVNVWIALTLDSHPHHGKARTLLESEFKPAFCRITQLGFLRLLTNIQVMGKMVMTPVEASTQVERISQTLDALWIHEPIDFDLHWKKNLSTWTLQNRDWTDAYLATLARLTQSRLVTLDQDFKKYPLGDYLRIL